MTARWQIHHQSYSRRLETAVSGSLGLLWLLLPPFLLSFLCSVYAQSLLQLISLICALRLTCWWGWRGAGWSPLGTIDGSPSHTPLMGGQIDSWDAHSGTSRCYHCVFVSVCILCVHWLICLHAYLICLCMESPLPPLLASVPLASQTQ